MLRLLLSTKYFRVQNTSFLRNNIKSGHIAISWQPKNRYYKLCGILVIDHYCILLAIKLFPTQKMCFVIVSACDSLYPCTSSSMAPMYVYSSSYFPTAMNYYLYSPSHIALTRSTLSYSPNDSSRYFSLMSMAKTSQLGFV